MKKHLRELAIIQTGYPFRSRLEMDASGNVSVVQMKDINEKSRLDTSNLVPVRLPEIKKMHHLKKEDLIFRSRGRTNTVALVDKVLGNMVVAAPLLCIRIKTDGVLPAYLVWYINQPKAQTYLERQASGTITRMIHKKALEDMEIELPSLERQQQIVALAQLADREQELLHLLAEKKKSYIDGILMKFATKR
jgi:restriction endonuclease S subunit